MGIPINPDLISNAIPYPNLNLVAVGMNVCQAPPEGPRAVSLQFLFNTTSCWTVDLNTGQPPVSQVASVYIDASASGTDVILIFPDTGYQIPVPAGKTLLCPVFTSKTKLPQFYILINSGGVMTTDVVNLIFLNFFIPEFAAG